MNFTKSKAFLTPFCKSCLMAGLSHTSELYFERSTGGNHLTSFGIRLSGQQFRLDGFHGNQTYESFIKFSQLSSSVSGREPWISSSLSVPTQPDRKVKKGRENGGWMVARCPVQFLLNLPSSLPLGLVHASALPHSCFPSFSLFLNFLLSPSHLLFPTLPCKLFTATSLLSTVWILIDASCYIQYISHMWTVYSVNWRMNAAATLTTTVFPFSCHCFHSFLSLRFPIILFVPHVSQTHTHTHTTPFPI